MNSETSELFDVSGAMVAVVHLSRTGLDDAIDGLMIRQSNLQLTASREQWVKVGSAAGSDQAGGQPTPARRSRAVTTPEDNRLTYLAVFTGDAVDQVSRDHPVEVALQAGGTTVSQSSIPFAALDIARLTDPVFTEALSAGLHTGGSSETAAIMQSAIRIEPIESFGPFGLKDAVRSGVGVVLDGWIADFPKRDVGIVTADLRCWVAPPLVASRPLHDTVDDLPDPNGEGAPAEASGFTAVLAVEGKAGACPFYFVERNPSDHHVTFYGPVTVKSRDNQSKALQLVGQAFGPLQSLPRPLIRQIYHPLLALPKTIARARPFRFGPAVPEGEPLSSIIIPFYGDAFFLNCVFHLQRVLGPAFELVLVCDDARIWPELYAGLSSRSASITVPTVLLQNADNYGYGRANNLGFMVAQGDVIFLMNSDIMVLDPAGLRDAAEAIRARGRTRTPELVVGFSLLYEDDSIQHIGMEFPRSPVVGNLRLADHPMKGLPFALYEGERIRSVPAVTGALMGLSSRLFETLGGFDPVYERGDFEDADLCLRARQRGAEIQLHVTPGLYHLERQSIPGMGDSGFRSMITHMNCVEFNHRWDDELSREPAVIKQPPLRQPQGRKPITIRKRNAV
jgi:GT2 family glycosyltransferase